LLSDDSTNDPGLAKIKQMPKFDIFEAHTSKQAIKWLKRHSPDFVICAGKINLQEDGKYVLDLNQD
jgi:hypothetical protein